MGSFTKAFVSTLRAFSIVVVLATAIAGQFAPQGGDIVIATDPTWKTVYWYVMDVHVVFGGIFSITVLLGVLLRGRLAGKAEASGQRTWPKRLAPYVLAILLGLVAVDQVIDKHPIVISDMHVTAYPARETPDQVVLTWSDDPRTTQAVQWRTDAGTKRGSLRYRKRAATAAWTVVEADSQALTESSVANDPVNTRHVALLTGLEAGTGYVYEVGSDGAWGDALDFTTAPDGADPFSFVYMGDVQAGYADWRPLIEGAFARHPASAFCVIAGDLVNTGGHRDDWDSFFRNAGQTFARRPIVPTLGNHDDDEDGDPWLYLDLFALPENGPEGIEPEHAYAFDYGNAHFVVLNSNLDPGDQRAWLEEQLASSSATWNIAVYHHPAYSSKSSRDNPEIRKEWGSLFDEYELDLALQGHDHAYLRTHPMRNEAAVSADEGTVYVVTVAGSKYYEQDDEDYIAVGFEELSTYQVIDVDARTLTYRAFDIDGKVVDEFEIAK